MRKIFGVEEKKAKRAILKNFDKKKGKCACFFHTRAPDGILIINLFRPKYKCSILYKMGSVLNKKAIMRMMVSVRIILQIVLKA